MRVYTRIIFQNLRLGTWASNRPSKLKAYGLEGIKTLTKEVAQAYSMDSTFSKIISNIFC